MRWLNLQIQKNVMKIAVQAVLIVLVGVEIVNQPNYLIIVEQ